MPNEKIERDKAKVVTNIKCQSTSHIRGVEVRKRDFESILEIHYSWLTIFLLEVIRFIGDWVIQNIQDIVHLLILIKRWHVSHVFASSLVGWEHKVSLRMILIIPRGGLHLFHVLEVPREGHRHALSNDSLHDFLTRLHFFRFSSVDNNGARILKHDAVEGTLVALIVDLDVLGVLPVDIDVMVVDSSDLSRYDLFGWLSVHGECVVDDHPSEHVEGSCIPTFGDTGTVHLQQELLHVIQRDP